MDKTGRNGIRIGDLELASWKKKYRSVLIEIFCLLLYVHICLPFDIVFNVETFSLTEITSETIFWYTIAFTIG